MIPAYFSLLANHLWQSTIFAGLTALLAWALGKNRAQLRYRLWFAASLKFLIPFSLLVSAGSQIAWRTALPQSGAQPSAVAIVGQINDAFAPLAVSAVPPPLPTPARTVPAILLAVWFCGGMAVLAVWLTRWRRIREALRDASPLLIEAPIKVVSSSALLEPGVFGVFKPVLLLPRGIADRLTPEQLKTIVAHELCHVRRHDNLAAAVHMAVEAIFWFHPLVWWIGARLVDERERACDEEVLRQGNEPETYAEGIINVCKFYLESPLPCASGVCGSDLRKRIETIIANRVSRRLTLARKLLLAAAATVAIAGPILFGVVRVAQARAQSQSAPPLAFEVASIKPAHPDARGIRMQHLPGGGLRAENVRLRALIQMAYQVHPFQIAGGPAWLTSQGFDILAKAPQSEEATPLDKLSDAQRMRLGEQVAHRLRALLAERFQLKVHRETKQMPVYALVVAKNGPKLKESTVGDGGEQEMGGDRGQLTGTRATIGMLANILARRLGRPVLDRTGLIANYDFKLEWTPDSSEPNKRGPGEKAEGAPAPEFSGPSIFTALQEQLGLRLEATKGPVEIIVIDKVEKPTEN